MSGYRYEVRPVSDAECSGLTDQVLCETNDLAVAKQAATAAVKPWGAGIEDTATGLVDYGYGFGVEVPDPEGRD